MDLSIALNALEEDAGKWHELSATLGTASASAAGLVASSAALSWAAIDTGLEATYGQAVTAISTLLDSGKTETDLIGDTLLEVRDAYQATDERARTAFAGMWEPRD